MPKSLLRHFLDVILGIMTKKKLKGAGRVLTMSKDLPSFHSEPAPPKGIETSRDIRHCHDILIEKWPLIEKMFLERTNRQIFLTRTWSSTGYQNELWQKGRRGVKGEKKVTNIDGINEKSRHNFYPSRALDVAVDKDPGPGKVVIWDIPAYMPLMEICLELGLRWGGDWDRDGIPVPEDPDERFMDACHIEVQSKDV